MSVANAALRGAMSPGPAVLQLLRSPAVFVEGDLG